MPYATNDELPQEVRSRYNDRCQTVFREAFNRADGDEASRFAQAHTAAGNCMGMKPMRAWSVPVITDMEFRAKADGGTQFTAYAALFDVESDASWMPYKETFGPTAFANALASRGNHTFVLDHDEGKLFASTRSGRLRLAVDSKGLITDADMPDTSLVRDFRALHEAGETRGMSIQFLPNKGGEEWTDNGARRRVTNAKLGHVTAITTMEPGYSKTQRTMAFRALAVELAAEDDDLDALVDAIREARALTDAERALFYRLARHYGLAEPTITEIPLRAQPAYWTDLLKQKGLA